MHVGRVCVGVDEKGVMHGAGAVGAAAHRVTARKLIDRAHALNSDCQSV
jgi:hypothetical protein